MDFRREKYLNIFKILFHVRSFRRLTAKYLKIIYQQIYVEFYSIWKIIDFGQFKFGQTGRVYGGDLKIFRNQHKSTFLPTIFYFYKKKPVIPEKNRKREILFDYQIHNREAL